MRCHRQEYLYVDALTDLRHSTWAEETTPPRCTLVWGLAHRRAHRLGSGGFLRSEPAGDHLPFVCGPTRRGLPRPEEGNVRLLSTFTCASGRPPAFSSAS